MFSGIAPPATLPGWVREAGKAAVWFTLGLAVGLLVAQLTLSPPAVEATAPLVIRPATTAGVQPPAGVQPHLPPPRPMPPGPRDAPLPDERPWA